MEGALRVLKAELKENLKNFGGAMIGACIGIVFLFLFMGKIIVKDTGAAYSEILDILILVMMLFSIVVVISLSQGESLGEIYPMASKMGNKRIDIALGLLLKDLVIIAISSLIIFLLTTLIFKNSSAEVVRVFRNIKEASFIINFIVGISGVSVIASAIAYIFRVNPLIGAIFGLIFAFIFFLSADVAQLFNQNNIWLAIGLFILGQIIRCFIITKLDTRF